MPHIWKDNLPVEIAGPTPSRLNNFGKGVPQASSLSSSEARQ